MLKDGSPLPAFKFPPVVETVLGVRFDDVNWQLPHFGLFWNQIRSEYPKFQVKPPLGTPRIKQDSGGVVTEIPSFSRCWFLDSSESRLLQVQEDRFIHNWRKTSEREEYPRYEDVIRPAFEGEWSRFTQFISSHNLGDPSITECEVTYVNHFERGREWEEPTDVADALTFIDRKQAHDFISTTIPTRCSFSATVEGWEGRLELSLQSGIRNRDLKEIFQLNVSAKGQPPTPTAEAVLGWLDEAREVVVRGFADITTSPMHDLWERIS